MVLRASKREINHKKFERRVDLLKLDQASHHLSATVGSTLSSTALRSGILINGGAVVAILTFLGAVLGRGIAIPPEVPQSLGAFAFGTFFCTSAAGVGYLAQSNFSAHALSVSHMRNLEWGQRGASPAQIDHWLAEVARGERARRWGAIYQRLAIALFAACMVAFLVGVYQAAQGFSALSVQRAATATPAAAAPSCPGASAC